MIFFFFLLIGLLKELEKNIIWLDKKYKICMGMYVLMLLVNICIMYIFVRDFL